MFLSSCQCSSKAGVFLAMCRSNDHKVAASCVCGGAAPLCRICGRWFRILAYCQAALDRRPKKTVPSRLDWSVTRCSFARASSEIRPPSQFRSRSPPQYGLGRQAGFVRIVDPHGHESSSPPTLFRYSTIWPPSSAMVRAILPC